jgi:hypothetical protein
MSRRGRPILGDSLQDESEAAVILGSDWFQDESIHALSHVAPPELDDRALGARSARASKPTPSND